MPHRPRATYRYGCALVSVALAIWFRLMLDPVLGIRSPSPFILFAVLATAWYGGVGPSLTALALGALGADYFLLTPRGTFDLADEDMVVLVLYCITGLGISLLAGRMHRARSRAEDAAEALARGARLLDQTHDAIHTWDWAGAITFWNLGAVRLYGYTREEARGRVSHELLGTEFEGGPITPVLNALERAGHWEGQLHHTSRDGASLVVDSRMVLIRTGARPYVLETNRDITERVETERLLRVAYASLEARVEDRTADLAQATEKLRASDERFRLLLEGVSDHAIFMLDPLGNVLTWSAGAQELDGYAAEEIIGRHYSCLFTPEGVASGKPEQELALAATVGKAEVEGWRVRKNGSRFWADGTLAALYNEDGVVEGFAKVTRDLTAKRRNDELLRSVLDHTLDGIITFDDHGTISMINRAGQTLFDRTESEAVGAQVDLLFPPQPPSNDRHPFPAPSPDAAPPVVNLSREVRGARKNGSSFPAELAVTEFQLEDHRYFVGIVRDISEKKTMEAQIQQAQKMEAFGQLAGGVAHDFNNLLTVISGSSEELLNGTLPGNGEELVGEIQEAAERAASLTHQLLAFSRQQVLEPTVLDLNTVVRATEKMLVRLIGEDVKMGTILGGDLDQVRVDRGQIEQVLINLAVNARDAMPQGGTLTIETRDVVLGEHYTHTHREVRPGRYVMMAVSDTGTGMPPEVRNRIFEPFFTTKAVGKGTGLGLAVVHGIVKQSGGNIEVYSEIGIGTTFKVYLPSVPTPRGREAAGGGGETAPRGTESILLVEDEQSVRKVAVRALQRLGYSVLAAGRGAAALRLLAEGEPRGIDLLVTDVVMPEMSGRQLAETLLSQRPDLKVLFLSGYTDDAIVRHGVLQANVAFLQKPFTLSALARKVRDVLDDASPSR